MFTKKRNRPIISGPTDFEHRVHTGYDPVRGKFVGLPTQWNSVVDSVHAPRRNPLLDPSFSSPSKVTFFTSFTVLSGKN